MALYEYRCADCESRFTALVRMGDDAPTCPGCGGREAERLLSAFVATPGRRVASDFTPARLRRDGGHNHH